MFVGGESLGAHVFNILRQPSVLQTSIYRQALPKNIEKKILWDGLHIPLETFQAYIEGCFETITVVIWCTMAIHSTHCLQKKSKSKKKVVWGITLWAWLFITYIHLKEMWKCVQQIFLPCILNKKTWYKIFCIFWDFLKSVVLKIPLSHRNINQSLGLLISQERW